jgi:hypothetical protein
MRQQQLQRLRDHSFGVHTTFEQSSKQSGRSLSQKRQILHGWKIYVTMNVRVIGIANK